MAPIAALFLFAVNDALPLEMPVRRANCFGCARTCGRAPVLRSCRRRLAGSCPLPRLPNMLLGAVKVFVQADLRSVGIGRELGSSHQLDRRPLGDPHTPIIFALSSRGR